MTIVLHTHCDGVLFYHSCDQCFSNNYGVGDFSDCVVSEMDVRSGKLKWTLFRT